MAETQDIEDAIAATEAHAAQSEPDHEIGDLQEMLRAAWEVMSAGQREELLARGEVLNVLEWLPGDHATP